MIFRAFVVAGLLLLMAPLLLYVSLTTWKVLGLVPGVAVLWVMLAMLVALAAPWVSQ